MVNYTLAADPLALTASTLATPAMTRGGTLALTLGFPSVSLLRNYETDLGSLDLSLDRIMRGERLINPDGTASPRLQILWQRHCESIESAYTSLAEAVVAIQATYDAAAQASASASEAQASVAEVQAVADEVNQTVTALTDGTLAFDAINVGGQTFYKDDLAA